MIKDSSGIQVPQLQLHACTDTQSKKWQYHPCCNKSMGTLAPGDSVVELDVICLTEIFNDIHTDLRKPWTWTVKHTTSITREQWSA